MSINRELNSENILNAPPEYSKASDQYQYMRRGGTPYISKYRKGLKTYHKLLKSELSQAHNRDGGINNWKSLGPLNIGGRARALTLDPDHTGHLFIGTAGGGMWKSTTNANSWTKVNLPQSALTVTDIVFDPFDSDNMYATTGEWRNGVELPGIGVIKSTDRGTTWEILPTPANDNFYWLTKILAHPTENGTYYVAGSDAEVTKYDSDLNHDGYVYKTIDGGNSWTKVLTTSSEVVSDLVMDQDNPDEFLIGTRNGAFITYDDFNTTESLVSLGCNVPEGMTNGRAQIAMCAQDEDILYLSRNLRIVSSGTYVHQLWKSDDNGTNWILKATSTGNNGDTNPMSRVGNWSHAILVDPYDCNRVLVGGQNLWKYRDNLLQITRISDWTNDIGGNKCGNNNSIHADQHLIVPAHGYNGTSNNKMFIANDGGIYGSNDIWSATIGSGWWAYNTGLITTQFYGGDISYDGNITVAGSHDNSYSFDINNSNGLKSWEVFSTGDGGYCRIDKDQNFIFSTTQLGSLYRSTDLGANFCNIVQFESKGQYTCVSGCPFTQFSDTPLFIAPFEMHTDDYSHIYLGSKILRRSTNSGFHWNDISPTFSSHISTIGTSHDNTDHLYVGTIDGYIYETLSPNTTANSWSDKYDHPNMGSIVTDIAVHKQNSNHIAAVTGGYKTSNIHINLTGHYSDWEDYDLGFEMHIESVTWHPQVNGWLYVATDVGVFASENYGQTWNVLPLFDKNEGPVHSRVTELFWQGNGSEDYPYRLCVTTFGNGMWCTETPIRKSYFVDKDCNPCGTGSLNRPYQTFLEAFAAAGSGSRIIFIGDGIYDEIPSSILLSNRIEILRSGPSGGTVVIR